MGTERTKLKMQHLQHPSTLVHMEESWETSPQPPTFTPLGAAMVWPRKMHELRHVKRQQELGNGQKNP